MDFGAFISGLTSFDFVFFLILFGFFVLGFAQGTIRRLLGLGALMFSFLFAANLRDAKEKAAPRFQRRLCRRLF